jgi:hypothetical protein
MQVNQDVRQKHPRLVVMETPRPYRQRSLGDGTILREFREDVMSEDLVWHQDRLDRRVTVLEGQDWRLQLQDGLPFTLIEGNTYSIPAKSWHRIIRGRGRLMLKIQERKDNMAIRLTETKLRQIIREEAQRLLEYEQILFRKNGKTYLGNDEGEDEYFDSDPESHGLYRDGDSVPYEGGGRSGGYGGGYGGGGYSRYGRSSYGRRRY